MKRILSSALITACLWGIANLSNIPQSSLVAKQAAISAYLFHGEKTDNKETGDQEKQPPNRLDRLKMKNQETR